jgi:hypothetical protein
MIGGIELDLESKQTWSQFDPVFDAASRALGRCRIAKRRKMNDGRVAPIWLLRAEALFRVPLRAGCRARKQKVNYLTLIVAGSDGEQAWMVADTAITDPKAEVRHRLRDVKIEPLQAASLVGFSDNPALARRVIAMAREVPVGAPALEKLVLGRKEYPRIELAYAFWDGDHTQLYKMKTSNPKPEKVTTLYLGSKLGYERFQRAKHSKFDNAPHAVHTLFVGGKSRRKVPTSLVDAIWAMWKSFATTSDREVGGWPIPYVLNRDGAFLVEYGYSVTDPIVEHLRPGSPIPLGTAEAGRVSFSLTELGDGNGFVAYWLQKPGGYVFIRDPQGGGTEQPFDGLPTEFIDKVDKKLGRRIELMFGEARGDAPTENLHFLRVLTDDEGHDRVRIEGDDRNLVFR